MRMYECEAKINKIRDFMDTHNYNGMLLSRRDSFAWLTCGGDDSVFQHTEQGVADLLITQDGKYAILSEVEKYRIPDEELGGLGFEIIGYPWCRNKWETIQKLATGKRIASDTGTFGFANELEDFRVLRYSLMLQEVGRLKEVCRISAQTMGQVCRELQPGDSEYEIAAKLTERLLRQGIKSPVCLIAVDERIKKYRHPAPGEARLQKIALVVIGAEKYGLFASLSRMVCFGEPSEEIQKKNAACMNVDATMIVQTRAGSEVSDIFRCGVNAYEKNGYPDEWKYHHQGGATGYHAREFLATFDSKEKVLLNQAYAWNPTIAGTKCEDTFIVTDDGPIILTETEDWPIRKIETAYGTMKRPDILVK